jgi:hypothetical protein
MYVSLSLSLLWRVSCERVHCIHWAAASWALASCRVSAYSKLSEFTYSLMSNAALGRVRPENETRKCCLAVQGVNCARRTDDAALLDGGLLVGQELAQQIHGLWRGDSAEGFRSFVSHHRMLVQVLQDLQEWRERNVSICGRMFGGGRQAGRGGWGGGVVVPW